MRWDKTFREAFCGRFECAPEEYERRLLRRGFHRPSRVIAGLIHLLRRDFFEPERRAVHYVGNSKSWEEFQAELASYRFEYRRRGGFLRKWLRVRLSGRRLTDIADALRRDLLENPWKPAGSGQQRLDVWQVNCSEVRRQANPARHSVASQPRLLENEHSKA